MPPVPIPATPRIVIYYQTQHHPDGKLCSILPIITQSDIAVTHVNVAAIHLNDPPGNITLVPHTSPDHPRAGITYSTERPCTTSSTACDIMGRTAHPASG